jgi:hypothetical protein
MLSSQDAAIEFDLPSYLIAKELWSESPPTNCGTLLDEEPLNLHTANKQRQLVLYEGLF